MAKELSVNVLVLDEAGNPVVLRVGDSVPAWASDQVGDHCFSKQDADTAEKPTRRAAAK